MSKPIKVVFVVVVIVVVVFVKKNYLHKILGQKKVRSQKVLIQKNKVEKDIGSKKKLPVWVKRSGSKNKNSNIFF